MKPAFAIFACVMFLPMATHAGDVYRWVDAQGRTHLSDVVPDQYKKSATRIDTKQFELTREQRDEAAARAASNKARDRQEADRRPRAEPAEAEAVAAAASAPKKAASKTVEPTAECEERRREYLASQECFAPFRLARGGVRAEAFNVCKDVPDPSPKCGIARPPTTRPPQPR